LYDDNDTIQQSTTELLLDNGVVVSRMQEGGAWKLGKLATWQLGNLATWLREERGRGRGRETSDGRRQTTDNRRKTTDERRQTREESEVKEERGERRDER
jgi:hypothetical protein